MNPLLGRIAPSLIRAINARKQPGDVDLGLGEPTLHPDPAAFEAALAWVRENGCPYSPNAGYGALREAIAAYHAHPGKTEAANVCVTVGSEEAIYLAIKTVLDPARDEVLIVEPCYLAYPKICVMEGIRHRTVAMPADDGFAPCAATLLEAMGPDTRMVILSTPSNPTGRVWPAAELEALARGLAERPGPPVYVLSDEVYRELYYTPEPPVSIAAYHPNTLVAGSLSKSNALTGLRLGWLIGPAEVVAEAVKVHQLVNTASSTFSEQVALALFRQDGGLRAQRPLYARRRELLLRLAHEHGVPHLAPEGAFYCMVMLPPALASASVDAAERLLVERRVVTVPGRAFGESAEGWLRLSWVAAPEMLSQGMQRIGDFFREVEQAGDSGAKG